MKREIHTNRPMQVSKLCTSRLLRVQKRKIGQHENNILFSYYYENCINWGRANNKGDIWMYNGEINDIAAYDASCIFIS